MKLLTNKQIILAVSGSIAAYKAPDIIRNLQKLGASVIVILTKQGAKFITELSLQIISKNKVYKNLWDQEDELTIRHIKLAKWADVIIVAPASANTISNISNGKANNLLLNVILASSCPLIIAPAMNQQMYAAQAIKANIAILKKRNVHIIYPEYGEQACGDIGNGRLADAKEISQQVTKLFNTTKFTGKKILITLGATIEAIDPVRYLSNYSSGKMGMALVSAFIEAGALVTVIHGNITTKLITKAKNIAITSANEMYEMVIKNINGQHIFVSCAAVSDYRVKKIASNKIKKDSENLTIELVKNKDILKSIGNLKNKPICIGFAAESENLIKNGKDKLKNKNCDAMIVNDITNADFGFNNDENEVIFLDKKSSIKIAKNSKQKIAQKIIEIIEKNILKL